MERKRWWMPKMVRVMFDCIEREKGPNSIFLQDRASGLDMIRQKLEDVTEDAKVYAQIDRTKILNKLHKMAEKGGINHTQTDTLYLNGVSALDLQAMPKAVFTKREISEARKEKSNKEGAGTATASSQAKLVITFKKGQGPSKKRKAAAMSNEVNADSNEDDSEHSDFELDGDGDEEMLDDRGESDAFSINGIQRSIPDDAGLELGGTGDEIAEQSSDDSVGGNEESDISLLNVNKSGCLRCRENDFECDGKPTCGLCDAEGQSCKYESEQTSPTPSKKRRLDKQVLEVNNDIARNHSLASSGSELTDLPPTSQEIDDFAGTQLARNSSARSIQAQTSTDYDAFRNARFCDEYGREVSSVPDSEEHELDLLGSRQYTELFDCKIGDCGARFISETGLHTHNTLHTELDSLRGRRNTDLRSVHLESRIRLDEDNEELLELMKDKNETCPMASAAIDSRLSTIQLAIHEHTDQLFDDLGTGSCSVTQLDVRDYDQSLINLLDMLYGPRVYNPEFLQDLVKRQGENLRVFELVRGLIGAAVTRWALQPLPQGQTPEVGMFQTLSQVLSSISGSMADHVIERATRTYLEDNVEPRISHVSHAMALEICKLLEKIVPPSTGVPPKLAIFAANHDPSLVNLQDCGSTMHVWPIEAFISLPYQRFMASLEIYVFKPALKLRVDMEKSGHAQYQFIMPLEGFQYDASQHSARNARNNLRLRLGEYANEQGPIIKLGLTPSVQATYKVRRGGSFQDEFCVIVKGNVLLRTSAKIQQMH